MHMTSNAVPAGRHRIRAVLAAIIIPIVVVTIIGLVWLWPRGEQVVGSIPLTANGAGQVSGVITSIGTTDSTGQTPVHMSINGTQPGEKVTVPVHVPLDIVRGGLAVGDHIRAVFTAKGFDLGTVYVFTDFERGVPLLVLVAIYLLMVVAVARLKGLAAIAGLGLSLAVLVAFMLPAIAMGKPVLPVLLVGASAMLLVSIYCAHGFSIRTSTAVLGTFFGIIVTVILAYWAVGATHLTGTTSEEAANLVTTLPNVDLRMVLVGGIVIAGLGALNDVTITQVSSVWELHAANPTASPVSLYRQGMAVGRDHIASTVYTLAFAYVGTALPLLLSAMLVNRPFLDFFSVAQIAEEIVRTLVASIGLVAAIPLTTAIAASLAPIAPSKRKAHHHHG